ncbi:alpha/beta hydrolase [Amycolatopsis sp. GM8]|uniref:alpha/beta hydrolase n=1 Tax=Amycolatopsis sp. GM8 TaxID=2896530 RepID=UPI001F3A1FEE|nr:alpha/beta hydrolase fold domain-containing protein [Amycolatopsis sp. GM8]
MVIEPAWDDADTLTAEVVAPAGDGPHPVLLHFHGGSWRYGSAGSHRRLAREFAARGLLVVMLNYRLAPRFRFPAQIEDGRAAITWIEKEIHRFGGDSSRLALSGDSAGAHIAGGVCVAESMDRERSPVHAFVPMCGIFDYWASLPVIGSVVGHGLPAGMTQPLVANGSLERLRDDPLLNVLKAAAQLPATYILCGSEDPLLPQSLALADELARAGVPHRLDVVEGAPHSCVQLPQLPSTAPSLSRVAEFVRGVFS